MARIFGMGAMVLQVLFACISIYSIFSTTDTEKYSRIHDVHNGPTGITHVYSYRRLHGFKAYQMVSALCDGGDSPLIKCMNDAVISEGSRQHRSNKYGLFTHILINILIRSGDVELNPGPQTLVNKPSRLINRSNNTRHKSKKCTKCNSVTRYRRFHCNGCGVLGIHMCPYCLTDELITHCNENNKIREYKCKVCIKTSDRINASNNSVSENDSRIVTSPININGTTPIAATSDNTPRCNHCMKVFTADNTKQSCNNCHCTFHSLCYETISSDNNCKLCLLSELPFFGSATIHDTTATINSVTAPSQMPNNIFECFKRKGLHFMHLNARSMYPKLSD